MLPPPPSTKTVPLREKKTVSSVGRKTVKYDADQLRKYVEEGKSNKDIAGIMNVSETTVRKWIKEQNLLGLRPAGKLVSPEDPFIGKNIDRHLCKTCMYRVENKGGTSCNYICVVGHSRGCKPEDCNVYKKGDPKKS